MERQNKACVAIVAKDRRRFLAGPPLAVLAMAGVLVVSAVAFIAVRAGMPSDLTSTVPHKGWRDDGAVVAAIRGGDTGLRSGDLVMAIDGRKLTNRAVPRASVGQRLRYTVRREGRVIDVPVTLRPYPLR